MRLSELYPLCLILIIPLDLRHIPLWSVGNRQVKYFEMALIRYDLPPNPSTPSSPTSHLGSQTNKPRAPVVRYRISVPSTPVGPQDLVPIPISLQPLDPAVTIRSASVIIERRITFTDSSTSNGPPIIKSPEPPSSPYHINNVLRAHSEPAPSASPSPDASTVFSDSPLLGAPITTQSKTIPHSVAGVESTGRFTRDDDGIWSKTLTLQWPSAKSNARWALGETIQTEQASVRFFARSKVRCVPWSFYFSADFFVCLDYHLFSLWYRINRSCGARTHRCLYECLRAADSASQIQRTLAIFFTIQIQVASSITT